jgi:hypothetical protein
MRFVYPLLSGLLCDALGYSQILSSFHPVQVLGSMERNYAPRQSRYSGAALREIRSRGQQRECARRLARMGKAA